MDEQLKKRLVGAIVLVSLAVIFVPMLLDEESPEDQMPDNLIPPRPAEFAAPAPDLLPERIVTQPAPAPAPIVRRTPPPVPDTSDTSLNAPSAWVIQVASFNDQESADSLITRLRGKGFPAFLAKGTVDGKPVYRVRVGPELSRNRIDQMALKIDKDFKVKTAVVAHR